MKIKIKPIVTGVAAALQMGRVAVPLPRKTAIVQPSTWTPDELSKLAAPR